MDHENRQTEDDWADDSAKGFHASTSNPYPRDGISTPASRAREAKEAVSPQGLLAKEHATGSDPHGNNAGNEAAQKAMGGPGGQDDDENVFGTPTLSALEAGTGLGSPGGLWSAKDLGTTRGRAKIALKLFKKNKKGLSITSIAVAFLIIVSIFASGPLEFVHIAQLLDKFHFSQQQDAQDGRLLKMARYIRDPHKPENLRLGLVGTHIGKQLDERIKKSTGLTATYSEGIRLGTGFAVDTTHPDYKGKSDAEIKKELSQKYGIPESKITRTNGTLFMSFEGLGKGPIRNYRAQARATRAISKASGSKGISTYAESRVLATRAGWTFHPIKKADQKIIDAAAKGSKESLKKLKDKFAKDNLSYETKGVVVPDGTPKAGEKTVTNADGTTTTTTDPANQQTADGINQAKEDAKVVADPTDAEAKKKFSAKTAGAGSVAIIGFACVAKGINDHIGEERQAKVMLPMMRKAGRAISLGSQAQSNTDISGVQLSFYKDFLNGTDDTGKKSNWSQARSIEAELGEKQTGPDIPKEGQVFDKGAPFDFLNNIIGLKQVCGALSSPLGQLFGFVTGPINYIVSGEAIKIASNWLAGWLSGAPISPIAAGADYGNYVNYGGRLSANDQAASVGGSKMSAQEEVAIKSISNDLDRQDFQSHNIAYRIFDTHDSRTLASKLIDKQDPNVTDNIASIARSFGSIFSASLKIPGTLLSRSADAATGSTYNYHGLKKVGFTEDELSSTTVENPFDNGCHVAGTCQLMDGTAIGTGILDGPNGKDYIDRAEACFGVIIKKDGEMWTTDSKTVSVDFESDSYPDNCKDSSNTDWFRVRFWLLDTATIEGFDCVDGTSDTSNDSCAHMGFFNTGAAPAPAADPGTGPVSGSAASLAQKIIDSKNVTLGSNPRLSLEAAAKGEKSPGGVDKAGGTHPPVLIDAKILAFLYDLSLIDSFTINSLTTGAHVPNSNHYKGEAVDLGCDVDTKKADTVGKKYGISHNNESCSTDPPHWHYSIGGN